MDDLKQARLICKAGVTSMWPYRRCACGEEGATDLGHIVYTRHPDSVDLYHPYNMVLLHNDCNINERLWVNVNACLICIKRAGGPVKWVAWALDLPRKGEFYIPEKMRLALDMWDKRSIRPFDIEKIQEYLKGEGL